MKYLSRLRKQSRHESVLWYESNALPGVKFAIRRMSLGQRIELTKKARELSIGYDFLKAGTAADQLEGTVADLLVHRLYLEWGVAEITGMSIDDHPATVQSVIEKGPEELSGEMLAAIHSELGLSSDERKNC